MKTNTDITSLINNTDSMDVNEKQYWIDILPTMTEEQTKRLVDILETEKRNLEELDKADVYSLI